MTSDVPLQPWQWPEATWRKIVSHVRAGRSLAPKCWKGMHAVPSPYPSMRITKLWNSAMVENPSGG